MGELTAGTLSGRGSGRYRNRRRSGESTKGKEEDDFDDFGESDSGASPSTPLIHLKKAKLSSCTEEDEYDASHGTEWLKHQRKAQPSRLSRACAWLAMLLQRLVILLESLIEGLGYEPFRRWETFLDCDADEPRSGGLLRSAGATSLCARAKRLAESGRVELALRLYVRVLEGEPDNVTAMDAAAELLAELGDVDGARALLDRSIELAPDADHAKFVLLGHLEHGRTALQAFERGLALLRRERDALGPARDPGVAKIEKQLGDVLVAMAKVYLTDCFCEAGAGETCESILDAALLVDPDSIEACQALADLRLSQGRRGEALAMLRRTLDLSRTGEATMGYDFRLVTGRLLVELSQYHLAHEVLEECALDDPEDTEVWYLLGLCHAVRGKTDEAHAALQRAKDGLSASGIGESRLGEKIDVLLQRAQISEVEKAEFWNPRWWVDDGGAADDDAGKGGMGPMMAAAKVTAELVGHREIHPADPSALSELGLPIHEPDVGWEQQQCATASRKDPKEAPV